MFSLSLLSLYSTVFLEHHHYMPSLALDAGHVEMKTESCLWASRETHCRVGIDKETRKQIGQKHKEKRKPGPFRGQMVIQYC